MKSELFWKVCTRAGKSFHRDPDGKKVDYRAVCGSRRQVSVARNRRGYMLCTSGVLHASRELGDALYYVAARNSFVSGHRRRDFTVYRVRGRVVADSAIGPPKVGCHSLTVVGGPYSYREARRLAELDGSF